MDPTAAVILFIASSAFWGWVVLADGAERLEGTFLSGFLVWYKAPEWPARAIRVFGVFSWMASLGWFVVRLCSTGV
jgi:hypothetical protein